MTMPDAIEHLRRIRELTDRYVPQMSEPPPKCDPYRPGLSDEWPVKEPNHAG